MTFLYRIEQALNNATFTDVGNTRILKTWQPEKEENVANSWMNLYTEGKYKKAEGVLIETLVRMKRGDPDKLAILNNMASIYVKQKKHTEAKDILNLTLMKMQQEGYSQTETLVCKCNLASVYAILDNKDKAETLVLEVLASLQQPNSLKDPFVQKTTKILEYLAKMQRRLSQSHPPTIGRIQPKGFIQFTLFPSLPPEIRNLVWEFAAAHIVMQSKIVTLLVQDDKIKMAYTRTQNLPLVCKESYAIYFEQYAGHNHNTVMFGDHEN